MSFGDGNLHDRCAKLMEMLAERDRGCPYCTEGDKLGKNWWCFEEWRSPWQPGDGAVANLDYDFGTWTLCIEDDLPFGEGRWTFSVPVEHCPKCGRELAEYMEVEE